MYGHFRTFYFISILIFLIITLSAIMLRPLLTEPSVQAQEKHFALIAGNVNQSLWKDIYEGTLQYAKKNNIAVEMMGPSHFDLQEHIRWLKIAIACRLDGLIFPAYTQESYTGLIQEMNSRGIPAVTVMYDLPNSGRDSYVGIDPDELGNTAALLIDNATEGQANIAVMKNSLFRNKSGKITGDPLIEAIVRAVQDWKGLNISRIESSPYGIFSTEEISRDILLNDDTINAFFCDSVDSTLGVTQMLVDLNRVGDIAVVGFMRNNDIDRYLANGIIDGVIHTDSFEIGRSSVSILHDLSNGTHTSSFEKIGFSVLYSPKEEE